MTTKDFQRKSPLMIFLSYFKNHKKLFAIDVLCACLIAAIDLAFPLITRHALYELLLKLESKEECAALFEDLCTRKEVENMAERVFAAKLLMEGNTYNQVIAETDISSATLSRISRCVQYGKGYTQVLKEK